MLTRFVSSLEKCFLEDDIKSFEKLKNLKLYKNETASFQWAYFREDMIPSWVDFRNVKYESDIPAKITLRTVESVPNQIPYSQWATEEESLADGYLRTKPGLYPDVLYPLTHNGKIPVIGGQLHTVWVDIEPYDDIKSGNYSITLKIEDEEKIIAEETLPLTVINAFLPEQETKVTNWFYADCIADYYDLEVFSDKHFEICERFIKTAVKNGINMILMPVFTPPLDTAVGHERTTTQLVKVTKTGENYTFDFSLCDRWLNMCDRCGVKYIEVSHLFTQWGAYHAPKIIAMVDGQEKQIFGWETDVNDGEYTDFLNKFLKEFTAYIKEKGLQERTYFHISDEPNEEHLEQYKRNRTAIIDSIKGFKQFDAMSHIEYYKEGLCEVPVPTNSAIYDFLKEDIKERWVYYCCAPFLKTSNRFIAMSSSRTRCIGIQLYKYGITGFLHWGYNYYNNQYSNDNINPFFNACCGYWTAGGDGMVVYPGLHGEPLESLRLSAFKQGLDDIRALKLCEKYYSKEYIIEELEKLCGEINFDKCINDSKLMMLVRDKIDDLIIQALAR